MELELLHAILKLHTPWLDKIMIFLTTIGEGGACWILLCIILMIIPKTRKCGYTMAISMAITFVLCNIIIKNAVARPRPFYADTAVKLIVSPPKEYSFPSGHASNGFSAAVAILGCNLKGGIVAIIFASLIAFTRLYLFVHYPTDILAGVILGTLDAILAIFIVRKISANKNKVNS